MQPATTTSSGAFGAPIAKPTVDRGVARTGDCGRASDVAARVDRNH
jgi:hypothetical protein